MIERSETPCLVRHATAEPEEQSLRGAAGKTSRREVGTCRLSKRDAPDGNLAVAAKEGDHAAFQVIVNRHKDWIYRYLKRHLRDEQDTQDVLQEVFLSTWRYLERYDQRRSFKIWLSQIVLNRTRDRVRRTKVRGAAMKSLDLLERVAPNVVASPETLYIRDQAAQRIEDAINGLPPHYKASLVLTVVEDLTYLAAGDRIGVSRKIIENRVLRAKERLAGVLKASDLVDLIE